MNQLNEKLILRIILAATFALLPVFGFANVSLAQTVPETGGLIINFYPDPLFTGIDFMPGDQKTGEVEVINNIEVDQNIITEAINYPKILGFVPLDDISRALEISIKEKNGADIYGGSAGTRTLYDFYANGETHLGNVSGNGGSKIFQYIISFPSNKGDQWQGKQTKFDIIVGTQGMEGAAYCNNNGIQDNGETGIDCGGGGCSVCGKSIPPALTIKNQGTLSVTDSSAMIAWNTSYKSTSQVVYCKQSENCVFDLSDNGASPPLYGYKNSSAEIDSPASENGVFDHSVAITGLEPATTYNYRTISHASPPTISRSYAFTTAPQDQAGSKNISKENVFLASEFDIKDIPVDGDGVKMEFNDNNILFSIKFGKLFSLILGGLLVVTMIYSAYLKNKKK